MKQYVSTAEVPSILAQRSDVFDYPDHANILDRYPPLPDIAPPSKTVVKLAELLGHQPKRILDIGCLMGNNALYLAAQGHEVTATDIPNDYFDTFGWIEDAAKLHNLNVNLRYQDVTNLPTSTRYDAIICNMVLHFLTAKQAANSIKTIQRCTAPGGYNVIDAYTEDNPIEEQTIRGLQSFFPSGHLRNQYNNDQWILHSYREGVLPKPAQRNTERYGNEQLIPTVVEMIGQKALHTYYGPDRQPYFIFQNT